MELETEAFLIEKCRQQIEAKLGWGPGDEWTTEDYERLSSLILEATQVQLSIITLKRLWGKVRYDSRPTPTTLNALARFAGEEDWKRFKLHHGKPATNTTQEHVPASSRKSKLLRVATLPFMLALGIAGYFLFTREPRVAADRNTNYAFSSKTVEDRGVPNSVIFDYDADAAQPNDTIVIQQSWDPRLTQRVERDHRQATSIYYLPGYFQAKLKVNGAVVKEHELFIRTNGWLPLVEQPAVPVYFEQKDVLNDGFLGLDRAEIEARNIALQPETPWVDYYNVGELADVYSNDFVFETALRNSFNEGSGICQQTEVHVLFKGASLVIPLSIPGCVSELNFYSRPGKTTDVSKFGVSFADWVHIRAEARDTLGVIFVNDQKASEFLVKMKPAPFAGVAFRFKGGGLVDYVQMGSHSNQSRYREDF